MPHPPAFGGNAARAPKRGGVGAQAAAALARAFQAVRISGNEAVVGDKQARCGAINFDAKM
jgi:hypothetical protein